jgi:hypothetical protein
MIRAFVTGIIPILGIAEAAFAQGSAPPDGSIVGNGKSQTSAVKSPSADPAFGIVPDTLRIGSDGGDDAPSIQRAIDMACAGGSSIIRYLSHGYVLASSVTQTCALRWEGQGWQEPNGGIKPTDPGRGTWFTINGVGFVPITISGVRAGGSVFEGFGVYQPHPAPSPGWAPTAYPYVFNVIGTNGETSFRHLMMLAINKGINSYYGSRLKVEDVRGQFFTNGIYADKNYDTTIIDDVRNWPYWSGDGSVMAYQQEHLDYLILARVDDAFIDRVFSLPGRSTLKLATSPTSTMNSVELPGGSPTNIVIGSIRSDFVKWTIWNTAIASQFDDVEISVGSLTHQGAIWGGLTPINGSAAIKNDGSFRLMSIGHLKADVLDAALVDGSLAVGPSTIQIGAAMVIFDHSTRKECYLLSPGIMASRLQFALPPAISGGRNVVEKQPPGSPGETSWNRPD